VEFGILGPTQVLRGGRPVPLPTGRGRSLLAMLVLHAGAVVSRDRLIDELWGDAPPPTVDTALHGLVSRLRRVLEPERAPGAPGTLLATRPAGYLLAIEPRQVDANRFRRLVADAEGATPEPAAGMLRSALALWRGPALGDHLYEPFAQAAIAELDDLRLVALERRIEADLALGRHREAVGELQALATEHPLRESVHALLMLALYRSGRQADALQVHADLRATLRDELGLDPGPALEWLQGRILRQDPTLELDAVVGASAAAEPVDLPAAERRIVSILSIDATVVTADGVVPDAEAARRVLHPLWGKASTVISGHGGRPERVAGGGLSGTFGLPVAREDDAVRAVLAAIDVRHLLAATNRDLAPAGLRLVARTGIDTGEALVEAPFAEPIGPPVRGASELRRLADEDGIVIGDATRLLVRRAALLEPLGTTTIDGRARRPWRLVDLQPGPSARDAPTQGPLVGRRPELDRVMAAYERTVADGGPRRMTVLGEAGIGKSRLAQEFAAALGPRATVVTAHCLPSGEGATLAPLGDVVRAAAGRTDLDAVAELLGGGPDAQTLAREILAAMGLAEAGDGAGSAFGAFRRLVESLARPRPLVVILEDLHWARPGLLDLVVHLAGHARGAILFLSLARPELAEEHPSWARGPNADSLLLGPLGTGEARELAASRLGGTVVRADLVARVLEAAQGNPFFIEQLLAAIVEEGDLLVPPTVETLLAARIDRLGPAEREVLRHASILGQRVEAEALLALLPAPARDRARRHLRALERKGFMRRPGERAPDTGLEFRHVLVQQAAYRSVTKAQRAELHERAATWLASRRDGDDARASEAVGHHLEQAFRHRLELGDRGAESRRLAERAGEELARAGTAVFGRFDAAAAADLLARARALLPADHPDRWRVTYRLAEAHETMGRHPDADAALSDLLATAAGPEPGARRAVELERLRIRLATGPDPLPLDEVEREAARALADAEAARDDGGIAQALFVQAEAHLRRGRVAEMEAVALRAMRHADRSDSMREQLGARRMLCTALEAGPWPVSECILRCEPLTAWRGTGNAAAMMVLARLEAMLGRLAAARTLIAEAEANLAERTRARRPLVLLHRRAAEVEMLGGDPGVAEAHLRTGLELGREMGTRVDAAAHAALLSRLRLRAEAIGEAARLAGLARRLAPRESVTSQALWRSTRAMCLAHRGGRDEAVRLAREAVALVPAAMLDLRADLHGDLAVTLRATGEDRAARDAADEAQRLYRQKGNIAAARLLKEDGRSGAT
jgi:DNA-binding SARP family transcriptional activator